MKINWKNKLSSRKLWAAIAAWITSILTAFNASESVVARTAIIISGIGALIVYMLAEAHVDAKNAKAEIMLGEAIDVFEDDAAND